jgi:hypothetical protein
MIVLIPLLQIGYLQYGTVDPVHLYSIQKNKIVMSNSQHIDFSADKIKKMKEDFTKKPLDIKIFTILLFLWTLYAVLILADFIIGTPLRMIYGLYWSFVLRNKRPRDRTKKYNREENY